MSPDHRDTFLFYAAMLLVVGAVIGVGLFWE